MASQIHWEKNIGRRLQLRDLQVFFTVAERSSMAKAASELGVTQPSISATIAGLETSLGVRLFDRSAKGVELTPFGRTLLVRGQAAFDELRQGIRDIEFLKEPDVGEVKIGCPEAVAAGFLPRVIDLLSRRHPRVSLDVVQVATPTLEIRDLDERRLDVVLATLLAPSHRENLPPAYSAEILFEDRFCVIAGSKAPIARRRKVDMAELSRQPWVIGPTAAPGSVRIAEMFRAAGVGFPERCVTTYSHHLRFSMVSTGRFVATMLESSLDRAGKAYGLKVLPIDLPLTRLPVAAVTLRDRNLSPVVDLFLKCAREVARTHFGRSTRS